MSRFLTLTKFILKNASATLFQGKNKNGNKRKMPSYAGPVLLLLVMVMCISIPLWQAFSYVYDNLASINQQGAIVTFSIVGISVLVLVFGIMYVISIFYFAKDVEYLLPLPLKPSEILGAKFISVLIYEYFTELIIFIPTIILYGYKSQASLIFYVFAVLLFIFIPVLPLIIASIIDIIIMRFTNIGKHKDAMRVVSGILAIGFAVGINIVTRRFDTSEGNSTQLIQRLFTEKNSLVDIISRYFPSSKLASNSLIYSNDPHGIINLLLFVVINVAAIYLFIILAEGLYIKGALGNAEVYSKRRKLTNDEFNKSVKQNSHFKAFLGKELKILFRTPIFLINCVLTDFIVPIMLIVGIVTSGKGLNLSKVGSLADKLTDLNSLGVIFVIIFAIGLAMSGMNGIASTSISREGQNIFVIKYLPIKFKDQIWARIATEFAVSIIPTLIMIVPAYIVLKLSPIIIIPAVAAIIISNIFTSLIGLLLDIKFPKLKWDNEQVAVKQNFNFVITMFGSWIVAGASIYAIIKFKLSLWYAFGAIVLVFGVLDLILYYLVLTVGQRWFNKINP
ncbi:hypothetical protein IAI10_11360 [Clostridium sp. 19966]|uniref:putative ABC exporter domain-containing protein n=1 Tax=Clostridium sp. 19966 TaxID=2768166 RepID=UPI0028DF6616|nr:putative ABC exporter domain-containing protein [Clostridium sp. 19966]MDT8717256.1 hypothetical protein [Clostridium sp. 19966]